MNILFLKTFDQMGLSRSLLRPSWAPFHDIVPGATATPVDQITLPMTFVTRENFLIENIQFEVADFEMGYNAFLGRPALSKFMACAVIVSWRGRADAFFICNKAKKVLQRDSKK
jgi:hypothetical protein